MWGQSGHEVGRLGDAGSQIGGIGRIKMVLWNRGKEGECGWCEGSRRTRRRRVSHDEAGAL